MNFLPLFVTADKGLFAKEGMESRSFPRSAMALIRRTDSGSVQFTISTPNRLLTSYEQGKPLLAIMNMTNRNAIDRVCERRLLTKSANRSIRRPIKN
jgi:ABC-type nitrate/sulfonate/bicarbonate transport system substrate-binding protein